MKECHIHGSTEAFFSGTPWKESIRDGNVNLCDQKLANATAMCPPALQRAADADQDTVERRANGRSRSKKPIRSRSKEDLMLE